ncbi:MAG: hypothetical protein ACK42H_08990 [Planctomycetota bacterium]
MLKILALKQTSKHNQRVNQNSFFRLIGKLTVVSSAGIFRKIHYGGTDLPQRGIMG